jgi:DNA repair protein RadA/Sms
MARRRTEHRCTDCGEASARWLGRCPARGAWNTLVEAVVAPRPSAAPSPMPPSRPVPIGAVEIPVGSTRSTGIGELDRVLGGGLVPGSVTLVGGEPGIGKSTLLLQALGSLAGSGATCLLVTAEESSEQVRRRARRLGVDHPRLSVVAETALPWVLVHVDDLAPDVVVVDSVQALADPDLGSAPGTVTAVRDCATALVRVAKERGLTVVLVGHVTKDGSLAGPRALEHVVDTVLGFEGDRHHALRLLRAVKHRFGSTSELGLFEMTEAGLVGVPDPSRLFLGDRRPGVAGSVVVPTMDGHRPLLVELQALVTPTSLPQPRRSAQGLDGGRLTLLLAVLQRRVGVAWAQLDVHASAVGGVRVVEPGADLALALALVSAHRDHPIAHDLVAFGEVGLGGEVRQVASTPRRLAEAHRLGFRRAVLPSSAPDPPEGMRALRVDTVADALRLTASVGPTTAGADPVVGLAG